MKNNAEKELSLTIHQWLASSGFKLSASYCKYEINSHPDYPAIVAVTDFLDNGNMAYQAVQADRTYIHEFNYPLLAHIKEPASEYMQIIPDATIWETHKNQLEHWSGIVIFPDINTSWHNRENDAALKKQQQQRYLIVTWGLISLALLAMSMLLRTGMLLNAFGGLSLAGLALSIAAVGVELGLQNNTVKQVCGTLSKGGCEQVLKSRFAKGIFGVTPGDSMVLYFATQFIVYLISIFHPALLAILPWLALTSVIAAGISLYTQAVILRQWCALCIAIAVVVLLQAGISLLILPAFSFAGFPAFGVSFLLLTAIYIPAKAIIKNNIAATPALAELKKWKGDTALFIHQLSKEQAVDTTSWEHDLLLGHPSAPIQIAVACNPYCTPCAIAHEQLDRVLDSYAGNVRVLVRLLCDPANEKDPRTIAVIAIMEEAATLEDCGQVRQMLTDWFAWMDLERWKKKWHTGNKTDVTKIVQKHAGWMEACGITHTPTLFVNGRKLPGRYALNDLERMIPQLARCSVSGGDLCKT